MYNSVFKFHILLKKNYTKHNVSRLIYLDMYINKDIYIYIYIRMYVYMYI